MPSCSSSSSSSYSKIPDKSEGDYDRNLFRKAGRQAVQPPRQKRRPESFQSSEKPAARFSNVWITIEPSLFD
jgi:hypothetical protein